MRSGPEQDNSRQFAPIPEAWNAISGEVIGCAMEVHSILGPGLLEHIYEEAMCHELGLRGIRIARQYPFRLHYKGILLPEQRLDLAIEGLIVVELKSSVGVSDANLAQLTSYLRAADLPLGLLINFNTPHLKSGLYRRINPYSTAIKALPLPAQSSLGSSGLSGPSEFGST